MGKIYVPDTADHTADAVVIGGGIVGVAIEIILFGQTGYAFRVHAFSHPRPDCPECAGGISSLSSGVSI